MDILADDELSLNKDDPRYKPKSQRGAIADGALGALSGVAMGTVEVATAPDAILRGNKKAAALRAQNISLFKPDDLGTAGEFTYGLTRDFTKVGWNALATIGTGGLVSVGAQAGLFGSQSYESEKSDLINMGADESTATKGAIIRGVTDAATFAIPAHGVTKNALSDAVATTGLSIVGGITGDYVEGNYLKDNKVKKVAQYGEGLQENATSPTTVAANGGMALLLNLWANKGKLRPEQIKQIEQNDTGTDAAHIQANIEHAEKSNIFDAETAKDANSHFYALDASMEQALNNEVVNLKAPVTGKPKIIVAAPKLNAQAMRAIQPVTINTSEFGLIKYNDPRLDIIADNKGIEMDMQWATPLIKAIRKSGEKSHNNQVSPKGARSVMQFIPSTFDGLKKKYNKHWDINNPIDMTEAAYYLVRDISREYKTQDPRVIAAHYNGGYKNGRSVQSTGKAVHAETIAYINRISKALDNESNITAIRGSDSEFPEFEAEYSRPPEYKSQSDAEISALPGVLNNSLIDDIDFKNELENNFKVLESSITKEDLDYLRDTAHYQPFDGNINRIPYVEPQVNLSGKGLSNETRLAQLEQNLDQIQTVAEPAQSTVESIKSEVINSPDNQKVQIDRAGNAINTIPEVLDNWQGTRSENYLKRTMAQSDGSSVQQLYNKNHNMTFERQINSDGTVSPVRAIKDGRDLFATSKGNDVLTKSQNDAAQVLEREFWQPKSKYEDGIPDLSRDGSNEYGSFASTADGREALEIMVSNPDMQITYTRLDQDGNEEVITSSARDLLDDIRDQEDIAKEDISAVKALASCAMKFGSDAV
ncbi:lytic transglycosylase domain-containing protein [Acinetobacter bereziniae]|uniref:lytic transglycosylase domain-containing protein n=1 Tax=Acinetobacter bereziniae TaxID=106648 RepID=UPI0018FF703D|nr:transglycosylase SLT domain-containing protein [Acinetobacter bereziniae]MBJ9905857.1 lytic transglycosylase domain-containing protein [Acinetobacter bereziniae]MBJ9927490.1 lytic transglycosylase domain-containing protein [Acinetobacter bereziniae]